MANRNPNPDTRFKPGKSGNPGGKPVAARNSLSNAFLKALCEDFDAHGREAIVATRVNHPDRYVAICASLVPKENDLNVNIRRDAREYTDSELASIIAESVSSRARVDEPAAGEGEPPQVH